ncbi:MAG TPA: glycosyltransferase family 4 protein [Syntrophales bacterium]|nr:glycosyltransferase family 4 protein [Syntrophales bacterium]
MTKEDVCFLYVGKLIPKKRIFDLLRALEEACLGRENIRALVVGAGELMEYAQQFASERRLPVTFTGFLNQTEILKAYTAADCLVLPSDFGETWGLVVNEAMACGLPAIVSERVGCGPDLVDDGVTGYIFPFGHVEGLAQKLIAMAEDSENRIHMGENALRRIQDYSVEKAVEGTLQAATYVTDKDS